MSRAFVSASSQYLTTDAPPVTTYPFTAGAWVWTDTNTIDETILYLGDKDTSNHRHQLFLGQASDTIEYLVQAGGVTQGAIASASFTLNTWGMACIVGASATSRAVYWNGGNKGTNTNNQTPTGVDRYAIGMRRSSSPGSPFSGKIDRAFIYNAALTDAEVAALYACGSPLMIRRANLIDYRKLGYFDPEPNWVGPGNTMTVVGATRDYGTPGGLEGGLQPWFAEAAAAGAFVLTALAGSYALTGSPATLRVTRIMSAALGSYLYGGQSVTLRQGRLLTAQPGSYALTGTNANLRTTRLLGATAGSYTLTGATVGLRLGRMITVQSGVYLLTGSAASLLAKHLLTAQPGSYAITGSNAQLIKNVPGGGITLICQSGSYVLTGSQASLIRGAKVTAQAGIYQLTGSAATLLRTRLMTAGSGAYLLTGSNASLRAARVLTTGSGTYILTGAAATLTYSEELAVFGGLGGSASRMRRLRLLGVIDDDQSDPSDPRPRRGRPWWLRNPGGG